jgi:hypothetical protein
MANTRVITLRKSVRFFFRMLFWIPVTAFSLLLIYNTLPYFSFSKDFSFIRERGILFQGSLYNACFYILLDWNHLENYELSLWISVIGNMLFAEWIIFRQSRNYLRSFAV